jgi:5-methylcytosine-specific restriction endonuclease McrA
MARIRTIKPEFFTSEDIVSMSPLARLLYISTWCEADKEGRLQWKPKTFKLRYFPADNCDIESLCGELVAARLVVPYGDGFAHIPGFAKHQHVNPRESKSVLPVPDTHVEREPSHIPADVRAFVMARDGGRCVRCGSDDHPQLDHILPQSCLGPHVADNLRVLCRSCNAGRPVSGSGLVEDLKKDGYTIQQLRVRFGIDASIHELTDREEGKGREGKGKTSSSIPPDGGQEVVSEFPPGFAEFWKAYPRKVGKDAAAKAFAKRRPTTALLAQMLEAITRQRDSPQWIREGGQFIPHPATWINEGRWQDDTADVPDRFAGAL